MLLGAAQANQQFETFENLKVANLLEQQLNWNSQQVNWLGTTENELPPSTVANEDTSNRYRHPYMDLSPMGHYHHGPEYLPDHMPHGYLHDTDHHGHPFPMHHYFEPDQYYDWHNHGHHEPGIHHGMPDYGQHYQAHAYDPQTGLGGMHF